jgi:hypothetical protein
MLQGISTRVCSAFASQIILVTALLVSFVSNAQTLTGLDWNGTGTVKRGLYWTSAVPNMAPMTVLMKKYPRVLSATDRRYYADFFWGNHGKFQYGPGYCNAYVGFHPYPRPNTTPQGNGHWELAVGQNFGTCTDVTTRDNSSDPEISWNRWHSQALTVRNTTGTQYEHKLYVDLPSVTTANTITVMRLSNWENPPIRSIMIGQTGDNGSGQSWGGEPRWEETNSIIRGIQIYSSYLTQQQILNRSACDTDACVLNLNSSEGVTSLWYLNMNPTPSDVSDKSGRGHHGVWDGSARPALWSGGSAPPPPTGPSISSVGATNVATSSATINWTTNVASDSRVEYGATTSYGQITPTNSALVTSHSMGLTSLVSGTTYHYRVRSSDSSGNAATSGDFTFTTTSGADTTPPAISAVSATNVTSSAATIRWTTNEAADSRVDYGTTTSYGQSTSLDTARVTSHAMNLGSLPAGTTFHYRVRSRDAAGNLATSGDFVFTTASAGGDTTPPSISAVGASGVTSSSASINWTTNEPADSQVEYGTTTSYGQITALNSTRVTSHSTTVSGLAANTTYYYRVRSRDAANNLAIGANATFKTTTGTSGPAPGAAYGFTEAAGSTTADGSGNGYNGTLMNGPVWTSGHGGNAILFDGVNDKVALPSGLDIATLPFTLEAWIKPSSRADYRAIFSKRSSYSGYQMRVDVGLYTSSGRVYVTTQRSMVIFAYAPPLNAWTHVAVVAEASGTKLYANGALQQTMGAILLGTKADAPVAIGSTGDNDDPFAGTIDDVRLYKRALSAAEIQADMGTGVP